MSADPAKKVDGRTARRTRGRDAVIDAVFRLLGGTELPTADVLAREAGVSTSSLFRYFDGLDDVYRQAADRFHAEHIGLFGATPAAGLELGDRIAEYVDLRLATLALMRRFVPVARTQTTERPDLRPLFDRFRLDISAQFERYFEPELRSLSPARRADVVSALDAATSIDAAVMIVEVHDRAPVQIRRAWTALLAAALPPA